MSRFFCIDDEGNRFELTARLPSRARSEPLAVVHNAADAVAEEIVAAITEARLREPEVELDRQLSLGLQPGPRWQPGTLPGACRNAAVLLDRTLRCRWAPTHDWVAVTAAQPIGDTSKHIQPPVEPPAAVVNVWFAAAQEWVAAAQRCGATLLWLGDAPSHAPTARRLVELGVRYQPLPVSPALFPAPLQRGHAAFPVVSGSTVELVEIDVLLREFTQGASERATGQRAREMHDALLYLVGLDRRKAAQAEKVLKQARCLSDAYGPSTPTLVRFSAPFRQSSYELALVLADRLARRLELPPAGRLIATGCSTAWHMGKVDTVDSSVEKCAYLAKELAPGDRAVLPKAWLQTAPEAVAVLLDSEYVRSGAASVALIDKVGYDRLDEV